MKIKGLLIIGMFLCSVILFVVLRPNSTVVNLGVLGDYSTKSSTASVEAYRAIELALDDLEDGKYSYQIVRFNIASYAGIESLKAELMEKDIDLIIGPSTSSQYFQVESLLKELQLPVFLLSVSADVINGKDDNLFRLTDTLAIQVEKLIVACESYLGEEMIEVYYSHDNLSFSEPFAVAVCNAINSNGGSAEMFEVGDLDNKEVQEFLLERKEAKGFVIIAGPSQAGIIADLLSKKNEKTGMLFPAWAKSARTLDYTRGIKNKMYVLSSAEPIRSENYSLFDEKIKREINLSISSFSYFGYEVTHFIDYVLNETGSMDLEKIKEFVHGVDYYKGNFNDFSFNDTGDGGRGYSLMRIDEGRFFLLEKLLD